MGVDFFPCDMCHESICDCGDYWRCGDGGHRLCVNCEAEYIKESEYDEDEENVLNCPFCAKEMATDDELLTFLLTTMCLTREQAVGMYRGQK